MTTDDYLPGIIALCLAIDARAAGIYGELAVLSETDELREFWKSMRADKLEHVDIWKRMEALASEGILPEVFENPVREKEELEDILLKVDRMLDDFEESPSVNSMFTLAYRLEFYVMHPAFEKLFNLLETIDAGYRTADIYEEHLSRFNQYMQKYGAVSPELDLLGETLFRLWSENRKLAVESTTDELTGILNRRGFFHSAKPLLHLAQRNDNHVSFMIADLDDFKKVNDRFGHPAGDRVLRQVAGILKSNVRASDIVGRYGGEEFIICFSTIGENAVIRMAEKIREAVKEETAADIPVTISVGIAGGKLGIDVDQGMYQLINLADRHLYEAKSRGKNQVKADFSLLKKIG